MRCDGQVTTSQRQITGELRTAIGRSSSAARRNGSGPYNGRRDFQATSRKPGWSDSNLQAAASFHFFCVLQRVALAVPTEAYSHALTQIPNLQEGSFFHMKRYLSATAVAALLAV